MNRVVLISPAAKKDFSGILKYLMDKWNNEVASNFIDTFEENLNRISLNPEQYTYYDQSLGIRKCVITKHNTLYFRENSLDIQIIRIYDVRQNPKNLKL